MEGVIYMEINLTLYKFMCRTAHRYLVTQHEYSDQWKMMQSLFFINFDPMITTFPVHWTHFTMLLHKLERVQ